MRPQQPTRPVRPQHLPTVADTAAACVLSMALGEDDLPRAAALTELQARVEALRDPTSPAALDELRRQVPLLEALWQRLAVDALRATRSESKERLTRAALQAQQAHSRTVALLHALALQSQGSGSLELHDDDSL